MAIPDQIHLEVRINSGAYISVGNMVRVLTLTQQAIFEMELAQMQVLRDAFVEIPAYVYDAAILRLYLKAGSSFLIRDLKRSSIIIEGFAIGLAIWLLEKTLGETLKEAWLDSHLHTRIKEFLTTRLSRKEKALGEAVRHKFRDNGIDTDVHTAEGEVVVYLNVIEDEEISASAKEDLDSQER